MKALDRRLRRVEAVRGRREADLTNLSDTELRADIEFQAKALSHLEPQVLVCTNWLSSLDTCRCGHCEQFTLSIPAMVWEVYVGSSGDQDRAGSFGRG